MRINGNEIYHSMSVLLTISDLLNERQFLIAFNSQKITHFQQ